MSFLAPKTNLPDGLGDNTPGRQATQSPNTPLPMVLGVSTIDVKWVTPVLHWTYRTTKTSNYAFFSCYGWIALGPFDYIRQIHINKKPYQGVYVHRSDVGDSPYVKTISKETPETFTFFWGTETEGSKNTHLNGLVRTADHAMANAIYPADRGIFSVSLRDVEAGQVGQHGETPALPLVQIEASRRSPKTYSFGHVDHGVNLAGAAYDLLTLTRGGAKMATGLLGTSWDTVITKLNATGAAGISGTDLFGSVVAAERQEVGEYLTEILSYFDGHIVERNGKLEIDYMAADDTTTDPDGLTVISEHHMGIGTDPVEDPDDQEDLPSNVTVTGLDLSADPPLQEASETASVPGASLVLGEDRGGPIENRRFWVLRKQLKGAAQILANQKALKQWRGSVPVLRQYAYHPDGTTLLKPGDRFDLDRADIGLDLVVRITERTEDDTYITFKVVGERGAFPRPYEPTLDPRADLTAQPPADLERFAAAQLPPDLSDAADTRVAMLVERASNSTVGFDTHFSPTDSWPGQVINSGNVRFAVAAVLQTTLGAVYDDVTITVDDVGDDFGYLESQSTLEQADDQLLLWHGNEWLSVGTISSIGGGEYTLAVKRARLASLPVAHAIDDVVFLISRNDLISITNASFAEVEDAGAYDVTTATKFFKVRPYTSVQGNLTAAFSTVLRDPTPDQVTGLAVVMTGKVAALDWSKVVGALVNEYQVYREAWDGDSWEDLELVTEVSSTSYVDVVPAYAVLYRWRVRAMATDETEGIYSAYVEATSAAVGAGDVDDLTPAKPGTPTFDSHGTYLADDGGAVAYIKIVTPALPTGATKLNILRRLDGDAEWHQVDQRDAGAETLKIDDAKVGIAYEFAVQGQARFGTLGEISDVLDRTAPGDTSTPSAPSSGGVSSENVVPSVFPGTGELQFGCRLYWDQTVPKDFSHWEVKVTYDNSADSITYTWSSTGWEMPIRSVRAELLVYTNPPSPTSGHARVRIVDNSGNFSPWKYLGQCNTATTKGAATMATQNRTDAKMSGRRTGNSDSATKIVAEGPVHTSGTLTGGAVSEIVSVSLPAGFTTKPDGPDGGKSTASNGLMWRYDWDHVDNTSASIRIYFYMADGSNITASQTYRIAANFYQNA